MISSWPFKLQLKNNKKSKSFLLYLDKSHEIFVSGNKRESLKLNPSGLCSIS